MFGKEKDLIKRIMNLILVIWIIVATFIAYKSLVNLFLDNPKRTYSEYKQIHCLKEINKEAKCKREYEIYLLNQTKDQQQAIKVLINSAGNIVIIGTVLFLLNKKEK